MTSRLSAKNRIGKSDETALLARLRPPSLSRLGGTMATIHDVALDAGVSPTTVSRYLNHRIELPASTSARIDAAILKLNYRPNVLARRLSTGKTEAIGLVTPEIREPFFAELASAVEDEADRHGYTIFMSSTRSDREREIAALRRLDDRHVDGLVMMTNTPDDGTLAKLIGRRRNVVLVDERHSGRQRARIFVENTEGAYEATRHLIEHGHRTIGYIGGEGPAYRRGAARRLSARHEGGWPNRSARPDAARQFSPEVARQAVLDFMAAAEPPTAIFASSDYIGIGRSRDCAMPGCGSR